MRILVWGLGSPGLVYAASLARLGHVVTGLDTDPDKIAAINARRSLCAEPGLAELLADMTTKGRLRAAQPTAELVSESDVSFISVGSPPAADGTLSTKEIEAVADILALGLRSSARFHTIALRSTVPPGFTRGVLKTRLETGSGLKAGGDFGLVLFPEFLREGSALSDFRESGPCVLGVSDQKSAQVLRDLWPQAIDGLVEVSFEEAEMLKLASNAFHALKIGFANEIGRLGAAQKIDPEKVMELIRRDTRLNGSQAYLEPGFAFGGSCLTKDLQALLQLNTNAKLPILQSILPSNQEHFELCLTTIRRLGVQRIGLLGLTFKAGTGDLRQSPALYLAARLQSEGLSILAYDPDLVPASLSSDQRAILAATLPAYEDILQSAPAVLTESSELLVLTQRRPEFASLRATAPTLRVIDLADPSCSWNVR